jgi:anthranilate phosphoribosyltransferase
MKSVAPIRKELGVRTFFNMLGPIVNPCFPKYQLLGVYNLETTRLYNYLLQNSKTQYSIVHSLDGYDEISLTSDFKLITKKKEQIIEPTAIGFKKLKQVELFGGSTADASAKIFLSILNGNGTEAQKNVVCANAAIAIQCVNPERSIEECIEEAKESLDGKKAFNVFKCLVNN